MVSDTLLHHGPSTPSRYIGSPIARGNTPARCGRVHQDQIILGKLLGKGGFGSVYVASIRGRTVAVKTYHKRSGNPAALEQSYLCELQAFRLGLKHSNIVSVLGATSVNNFTEGAWIVMEYVGERNLQNILNDPKETLEHNQRLSFALQIARGLHYLHSVNVVHLDLKPANIMVTADMKLKIADFGCCHQIPAGNEEGGVSGPAEDGEGLAPVQGPWRNELAGTLAYRAPELLKGQRPALRSDVYSLGITLWQMQSRSGPYEGVPVHSVVFQVVARHLRPQHRSAASLDADNDDSSDDPFELVFSDLYTQCWAPAVEDRPTSLEVVHVIGLWMENLDK